MFVLFALLFVISVFVLVFCENDTCLTPESRRNQECNLDVAFKYKTHSLMFHLFFRFKKAKFVLHSMQKSIFDCRFKF